MTLRHTDELLDIVERNVDEDDMTRMLKHDYRLTPEEEQPDYVVKGNRVFEALMDFIKLLKHTVYIYIYRLKGWYMSADRPRKKYHFTVTTKSVFNLTTSVLY